MFTDRNATWLARLGFAARGLVYLLVGWFAIDAAFRDGQAADNQGAIASLADEQFGHILLAVIAAGMLGYAVWRLTEGLANPERIARDAKGNFRRLGHLVSGTAHVILAWTAARIALDIGETEGGTSPGDESARDWTAWLLAQPFGQILVGIVAVGLVVAAGQQARKAWTGGFAADLRSDTPTPTYVCTIGRLGYGARALVFVILAGFFTLAAWQAQASEAGGMAAALGMLQGQPGGQWLLAATGIGLGLFGIYSFVEARYRRIHVDLPGCD
ncbi:hypothetical protein ASG67_02810 [Sphingomonas sp. Leaf339]|uniref:DUF1206 domain-containing protein n=1 Tax=Sphingomonas sp. Leaf339 TaxID=1736343 RepID=UPI0006FB407C|nr:DUF1206 domain-containing protein [Sphingomonas sp. Leaf339]KQU62082.1 hypothetical protein ASG67_02810 [Sphingomonas sp. Leaf339]